jgi:uncharacterized protein (TIGR02646 family)
MRTIVKGREPASLTQHRLMLPSNDYKPDYDNYSDKDALRKALVREQRGLCCYCMKEISSDREEMKIEHWQCQSRYSCKQLNYRNLLAACPGGEGQPPHLQHCDTKKGDNDLKWNPANPAHRIETRLRYEVDGSIRSDDPTFDAQLCQVLNLNLAELKNRRKGVLDAVLEWWLRKKVKIKGPVPRSRLVRERNRRTPQTGEFQPYCQVSVWWLDQRLKKMTS